MRTEIISDGSQIKNGDGGCAVIIRFSAEHLPIKILAYLGKAESSEAELWAVILGFGMLKFLNLENHTLKWVSDSKTTIDCLSKELNFWSRNSWLNRAGASPKHLEDWKMLDKLSSNFIVCGVHKQRSTKHRDLSSCDKASRWAARLGDKINNHNSLQGKNSAQDPRYAWQVIPAQGLLKLDTDHRIDKLNQLLNAVMVYKK